MAALFGVHIGNSSVCLAICKDEERTEVVANDAGDRITPTILQWSPSGSVVGKTAQLELFRNSQNTVIRNKEVINTNICEDELNHLRSKVPYKINKSESEIKYELLYEGKQHHVAPREIVGWIFKKILSIAQAAVGVNKEIKIVATVPLNYSQKSIQLIKDVAKIAGFHVLQVVDEACAAALGCGLGLDPYEPPYYCIVYRVGGVSVDATIILIQDGMFTIVESVHKYNLGGTLFTEKLSEFLASEFTRQYRTVEISERGKYKLLTTAETAKQVLSIQNVVQCSCESLGGGYDFNCSVSRARYENIIAPLIPEIIRPITEVLNKANIAAEKIAKVVTCGGTLKTPKLQETIRKLLPSTEVINCTPDEVIALGAAKQAGYLTGHTKIPDTLGIDTPSLSTSLQIKVKQDGKESMTHIVPEYSSVPLRKKYEETAISQSITVSLVDKNNKTLGSVSVSNLEPPSKVTIILDISKDGQMHLTLVNQASKEKTHMKYNLTDISKI